MLDWPSFQNPVEITAISKQTADCDGSSDGTATYSTPVARIRIAFSLSDMQPIEVPGEPLLGDA